MTPKYNLHTLFSRRELLGLMGAAGAAFVAACGGDSKSSSPTATAEQTASSTATAASTASSAAGTVTPSSLACIVTPEQTEGPFFVDEQLNRSDITTDPSSGAISAGVPPTMNISAFRVQDGACTPLAGATIDAWHCDAEGVYSDVAANNTVGQKFLRGSQTTDDNGVVTFATIYPGWYQGRAPHIHFKLRTFDGASTTHEFTSQLYFDDATSDEVYAQAPYNTRGDRSTLNSNDSIYGDGGEQLTMTVTKSADGYVGTYDFGLAF